MPKFSFFPFPFPDRRSKVHPIGVNLDHLPPAGLNLVGDLTDIVGRLFEDLEALTLEDVNSFIRETLSPEKSWLVLVGPEK